MLTAYEADEVIALLEGREAPEVVGALFAAVRESWLVRGLLNYHARTGSTRALDLLARAPEPHARFLLDALIDHLRADRSARHQALAAIAPLVARRPAWLHRLPAHPVARELMRAARQERSPLASLHALLSLAALLPAEPALAAAHLPELADALLRPPALESPPPPPPVRDHLLLARLALFHALYATHPCTLLDTLRAECAAAPARDSFERALAPLLRSVRLHPHLVTGSRQREADPARWARVELHDVLVEARRLSLLARDPPEDRAPATFAPAPLRSPAPASPAPGSGAHAARAASALRPGAEPWFPLADRCGAESAPNTPLPAEPESAEPPEAAVEATPENTPAKDARTQFRFPNDSAVVRAIGRRPSPPRKETSPTAGGEAYAGRLARVALERRAAESPVPFGGGPPPAGAVPRPEPSRGVAAACDAEPLNVEDREVLELTERAAGEATWDSGDGGTPAWRDPRAKAPRSEGPRRAKPARRASSCSPALRSRTSEAAAQTVDTWPAPYEFLIADFFRSLPDAEQTQVERERGRVGVALRAPRRLSGRSVLGQEVGRRRRTRRAARVGSRAAHVRKVAPRGTRRTQPTPPGPLPPNAHAGAAERRVARAPSRFATREGRARLASAARPAARHARAPRPPPGGRAGRRDRRQAARRGRARGGGGSEGDRRRRAAAHARRGVRDRAPRRGARAGRPRRRTARGAGEASAPRAGRGRGGRRAPRPLGGRARRRREERGGSGAAERRAPSGAGGVGARRGRGRIGGRPRRGGGDARARTRGGAGGARGGRRGAEARVAGRGGGARGSRPRPAGQVRGAGAGGARRGGALAGAEGARAAAARGRRVIASMETQQWARRCVLALRFLHVYRQIYVIAC
ncbi:fibril-forming collagen alpha chain isoform X1 [Pieris rapae]|uniref:fibril-forming collagen alpha chain isoform X1 n=1 Tax=Pieris rapae TaxID=64459 RepID=UPI001E27FF43|nr:fibril-forming collagen alpha chain isoform X1 [Pieris rapae]